MLFLSVYISKDKLEYHFLLILNLNDSIETQKQILVFLEINVANVESDLEILTTTSIIGIMKCTFKIVIRWLWI